MHHDVVLNASGIELFFVILVTSRKGMICYFFDGVLKQ